MKCIKIKQTIKITIKEVKIFFDRNSLKATNNIEAIKKKSLGCGKLPEKIKSPMKKRIKKSAILRTVILIFVFILFYVLFEFILTK